MKKTVKDNIQPKIGLIMKRKATIGLFLLLLFPFFGQLKAENVKNTFSFNSLLAPPTNDECVNATSLTVNQDYLCNNVTSGTLSEATASTGTSNFCGSQNNANDDVWFEFVATAVSHKFELLNIAGNQTSLYHMVYDGGVGGTCPTTELPIHCSSSNSSDLTGLTIGNTYVVRVFSNSQTAGADTDFDVCIGTSPAAPPANDECANAEDISSFPFSGMYDASTATNNAGSISPESCIAVNDGVWYTITGNGGDITVTVTPTGWDAAIGIYEGSCGNFTCVDDSNVGVSGAVEAVTFTSTASTTYYINIASPGSTDQPEGIFDLGITSSTLSIDEIVAKGFYYYPNPVINILKMSANEAIAEISLFTILGKEIKRTSKSDLNAELDMSDLASGTYFVRVLVGDSSGSFKIIKN